MGSTVCRTMVLTEHRHVGTHHLTSYNPFTSYSGAAGFHEDPFLCQEEILVMSGIEHEGFLSVPPEQICGLWSRKAAWSFRGRDKPLVAVPDKELCNGLQQTPINKWT